MQKTILRWLVFGKNNVLKTSIFIIVSVCLSLNSHASSDKEDEGYRILACTRPIDKGKPLIPLTCFEHCYVKFVKGNSVLDSRGFFQDIGPAQERNIFDGTHTCETVKFNCSPEDWLKVTSVYDKCVSKDYNLASNNCCSVAQRALQTILQANQMPSNITNVNSSIGTQKFFKKD